MASYVDKLKDTNGNIKYPVTLLKAIYNGDTNERLDNILNSINNIVSNLSIQIDTIQTTVSSLSEEIDANNININEQISNIDSQIDTLQNTISNELSQNISNLEIAIENINTSLSSLSTVAQTGEYSDLLNAPTIYSSTEEPTSADGKDGDVWFVYTE